jgi:hypothetical protein
VFYFQRYVLPRIIQWFRKNDKIKITSPLLLPNPGIDPPVDAIGEGLKEHE